MKTVINARVDAILKAQLEKLAKEMGISLSALISAALTKVAKEQKIELTGHDENGFSKRYVDEFFNDPDREETVFVAKTPEDVDTFFQSLETA